MQVHVQVAIDMIEFQASRGKAFELGADFGFQLVPKPALEKYAGQQPEEITKDYQRQVGKLFPSPFKFKKYGKNGVDVSELYPHLAGVIDDVCVIRSMHTDIPNHEPGLLMMNSGNAQPTRPSLGSWLTYGLGTENQNLPGYVVLCPDVPTTVGPPLWNSAFLPAVHQGTFIADKVEKQSDTALVGKDFDPKTLISYIHNDKFTLTEQRRELDLLTALNRGQMEREPKGARGGLTALVVCLDHRRSGARTGDLLLLVWWRGRLSPDLAVGGRGVIEWHDPLRALRDGVQANVGCNPVEPGPQGSAALVPAERAPGTEHHLLQRVSASCTEASMR